uniref:Four-carbon acid sugar kinase family protein n=1 Tax=Paulinella longichromatophora TaxID=1708747 RepID=A0A2H4ZPM3_9EUKA|nr:hypothetical protein PLO_469 [Paulinella longichromatophora]
MASSKILIIDDDPTGSQTVNSCPLLLSWDQANLRTNLRNSSPLLFILANTRGMPADAASKVVSDICQSLKKALLYEGIDDWLIISRSDSTLRGHFPIETDIITTELGYFQATFFIPCFLEGHRKTIDAVHILEGIPIHKTPFARDHLFGFSTSFLPQFISQKSNSEIKEKNVVQINSNFLDKAIVSNESYQILEQQIRALNKNAFVVVDAQNSEQLKTFSSVMKKICFNKSSHQENKRFLFRSAASFITELADLPPQPLNIKQLCNLRRRNSEGEPLPGLIMVGSYVPLADSQLENLLADPLCTGLELPLSQLVNILKEPTSTKIIAQFEQKWFQELQTIIINHKTPVLFTSRGELNLPCSEERLVFGRKIAELMARLAAALAPQLGYLISKGGITSQLLLTTGLNLSWVYLDGQILPGLSLVRQLQNIWVSSAFQGLPILTFPGNLGNANTLKAAWSLMESGNSIV